MYYYSPGMKKGITSSDGNFKAPDSNPWVLIAGDRKLR
jgi:hypothetical protein